MSSSQPGMSTIILLGCVYAFATETIAGDCDPQEIQKLIADDGAPNDIFGAALAIDNAFAVIGAPFAGGYSGSAYVFDAVTGEQVVQLIPDDLAPDDKFGYSVAIGGNIGIVGAAIVGAPFDDDHGDGSGAVYLFDATTGDQVDKLVPLDNSAGDWFGRFVAVAGDVLIISAPGDDDNGDVSGSAYLFEISTGEQITKLLPDDGAASDQFGRSVAIYGGIAIVGVPFDDDYGSRSGSAYLFDATSGEQLFKLLPNDGAPHDRFGHSVSIAGTIAIVGAWTDDDSGDQSGSAYLFDTTTGEQLAKLLASDGAAGDRFGSSVAMNGPIALVGAPYDDDQGEDSGSVYLFNLASPVDPVEVTKIVATDGAAEDSLAFESAIGGDLAIVSAAGDDDNGEHSGSAYVLELNCPSSCPADINGDHSIDVVDLLLLLAAWGESDGPEDINGDGIVDVLDLLELLAAWGPCP